MKGEAKKIGGQQWIAIAKQEDKLYAVCLSRQNQKYELLWKDSCDANSEGWQNFARKFRSDGVSGIDPAGRKLVLGFDCRGISFYKFSSPAINKNELSAIVKLQAESKMPLPVDEIELTWRAGEVWNGTIDIVVAAARRKQLQGFVENITPLEPDKILLDCEGMIAGWKEIFGGNEQKAILVNIRQQTTQICLADSGLLNNFASLDFGMNDLNAPEGLGRFAFDFENVTDMFGLANQQQRQGIKVFVLSGGDKIIQEAVERLRANGFDAYHAQPDVGKIEAAVGLDVKDVYEYRSAISAAIGAMEEQENLNLFERIYLPAKKESKKHWNDLPTVKYCIAAAAVILTLLIFYWIDAATAKRVSHLQTNGNLGPLVERQKLIKEVARQRPDVLGLLKEISSFDSGGLMLDVFDFKKGRPVTIIGNAPDDEKVYKFQKELLKKKDISQVKVSVEKDSKSGKVKFTMTFHYKNFTKKK